MVELPKKKVGIVACSGEELPEGTVTRLAALQVLEHLRPEDTVTICLPLFLAGGEGDRAFARFYPTIAVDGCEQRCAARATELYSGRPAAGVVVTELVAESGLERPQGRRRLDAAGRQAVEITAARIAEQVTGLLDGHWNRRAGRFEPGEKVAEAVQVPIVQAENTATCACGSGIPVQKLVISGKMVILVGLPLICAQLYQAGKTPGEAAGRELLESVRIYNPVPVEAEGAYLEALGQAYRLFYQAQKGAQ